MREGEIMKKVIIIILLILLIPIVLINIKTLDREEVNPTLTYNLTTTDSTYTDLNDHTLQEVFESTTPTIENKVENGDFSDGDTGWVLRPDTSQSVTDGINTITANAPGTTIGIQQSGLSNPNSNVFHIKIRFNSQSSENLNLYVGGTLSAQVTSIPNVWNIKSTSLIVPSDTTFRIYQQMLSGQTLQIDYVMMFNLTASHGVTETSGTAYDQAVAEIEWILSKNDGYIQSVGNPFEIVDLTVEEMDDWYTIYQNYHTTYTTLTLGTATATTYTSLQQLILDNADKDFKLYRNDVVDETHYRLTQESGYISITNDDDLEIMRINDDDTFESSLQVDDTIDYKLVGYNVTSYIDGDVANEVLPLIWLIPIVLVGAVFFIIFTGKDE